MQVEFVKKDTAQIVMPRGKKPLVRKPAVRKPPVRKPPVKKPSTTKPSASRRLATGALLTLGGLSWLAEATHAHNVDNMQVHVKSVETRFPKFAREVLLLYHKARTSTGQVQWITVSQLQSLFTHNADLLVSLHKYIALMRRIVRYRRLSPVRRLIALVSQDKMTTKADELEALETDLIKIRDAVVKIDTHSTGAYDDHDENLQALTATFERETGMHVDGQTSRAALQKAFRQAALKLHPNRPGGNADRFKTLSAVMDKLESHLK